MFKPMKIAALTRKEWLGMLILGSWLPAIMIAALGVVLGYQASVMALSFGFFLHSVMVLGDVWWCVSLQPDWALIWLFSSFISRIALSGLVLYLAYVSNYSFAPMGIGYVGSMLYCMYRKTMTKGHCPVDHQRGGSCHNH